MELFSYREQISSLLENDWFLKISSYQACGLRTNNKGSAYCIFYPITLFQRTEHGAITGSAEQRKPECFDFGQCFISGTKVPNGSHSRTM